MCACMINTNICFNRENTARQFVFRFFKTRADKRLSDPIKSREETGTLLCSDVSDI